MASLYQRNGIWKLSYKDAMTGVWRHRSLGKGATAAEAEEALLEARKLERRGLSAETGSLTFREVLARFLKDKASRKRDWTVKTYRKHGRHFEKLFPIDLAIRELRPFHFGAYLDARLKAGIAPQTVNKERTTLATIWNWAQKQELAEKDRNPVQAVDPFEEEDREPKVAEENLYFELVLNLQAEGSMREHRREKWARQLVADMVQVMWWTGLRAGECCKLLLEDVDLVRRTFTIRSARNKGGRATHPIPEEVFEIFDRRTRQRPVVKDVEVRSPFLFPSSTGAYAYRPVYTFWTRWVERFPQYKAVRFHSLRHAYTTDLKRSGVDFQDRLKLERHKTVDMQKHYTHIDLGEMRAAQGRLSAVRKRPRA